MDQPGKVANPAQFRVRIMVSYIFCVDSVILLRPAQKLHGMICCRSTLVEATLESNFLLRSRLPGRSVSNLETFLRWDVSSNLGVVTRTRISLWSHELGFGVVTRTGIRTYTNSTSRSTRERDGGILLAIKIEASTIGNRVEKT